MKRTFLLLILFALIIPASSYARTWLVRQDGSDDCTTIKACCDSAAAYDTVLAAAGVYHEKVTVPYGVNLFSEEGPSATVISPPTALIPVVTMASPSIVDGFTLRCDGIGVTAMAGGAELLNGGTLRNCVIVNCTSQGIDNPGLAGGIAANGDALIEGNTIVNNGRWVTVGGIYCGPQFVGRIERNIIALNTSGYGIYCEAGSNPTLICNNVWGNAGGEYGGACGNPAGTNGNISVDPLFCEFQNGDYRLRSDSPCLNAPGCTQIGAFGAGCGPTAVTETTWGKVKVLFR